MRMHPVLRLLFALLVAVAVFPTFSNAQQPAAFYAHGKLSVTLPYHSAHAGKGRLTVEILDPEDHVLGRSERPAAIARADDAWQQTIRPAQPIAFDDLVWQRVRYRFVYDGDQAPAIEGIEAISRILRRPVVRVLGQTSYLAGSEAAVRVIVSDGGEAGTPESGTLRVELLVNGRTPQPLFSGKLNHRGTVEARFRLPAGLAGKCQMRYVAETPVGATEFTQPIEIDDKASILLTTEKPIYQPGQTIHVRALALNRANHRADGGRPLTFEVEDSRGNKVFRHATVTSPFGVASAEFALADEVNLGTYHLRALVGDPAAPSDTAEIALNVERYVLPKFKVAVDFTPVNGKPRRDYRPGDHLTGTVRANYFFGQPVAHAKVALKATSADVDLFEAGSASGETDGEGEWRFDLQLPAYFAGRAINQDAARALVEATVTNTAGHAETRGEPVTISESALLLTAVPEGGTLVPGLENEVFLLSAYPDGAPAATSLTVQIAGERDQHLSTDAAGIAVMHIKPGAGVDSLHVEADDHHGARAASTLPLQARSGEDQILLRADRAIYKAGDPVTLKVYSTRASGSAYIDLVKDGQTILTRDLDLRNGQAELTLTATPAMAGSLDIDAYLFGRDAQPVSDHRLVFVQPADELKIATSTDSPVYQPGGEARVRFHVTNGRGEGVSAALGLQVVDEAVFALAERQPGFAKVFFYLEQEVMKPRYEIHSFSMPEVIGAGGSHDEQQEREAKALFSATEMASGRRLDTEFGRSLPQAKFAEYQGRYRAAFLDRVREIAAKLSEQHPGQDEFTRAFEHVRLGDGRPPRDAWSTPLRIDPAGRMRGRDTYYLVRSAGPDGVFDTPDDLTVYLADRCGSVGDEPGRGSLGLKIEHGRGPLHGRAEVTGTVVDETGAVIPDASITLREIATGVVRSAHADASGSFTFSFPGLAAGRYRVEVVAVGFNPMTREFSVAARDRAVLSVPLAIGSVSQNVAVNAATAPVMLLDRGEVHGFGSGFAEGKGGGAIGGVVMKSAPIAQAMSLRSFAVLHAGPPGQASTPAHVRSWFPEALYINPEIVTDAHGDATISIPIADSITTLRMAMLALTQAGALGSGTASLKVFQEFFADLDLPVTLTQGDRVTIPAAVYNYSGSAGETTLELEPAGWYSLDGDTAEKTLPVESGKVGGAHFTLSANRIGKFKLTLKARLRASNGQTREDIVVREIEIVPNGREQNLVMNGRLDSTAAHDLNFPADAIPDATSILVRLYPGPLSQVIEGMDSILSMPGGCFEQTSSSTYPDVLALDYMKRTKKLTPEVHAKAEGYIANGYQRLLTFEVPGGGFSWFGQAPANKILTAYGLMEFNDMAKVADVDPKLIERTRDWLIAQQQPDGSWRPDTQFINEGATNRYNSNVLRITAYIAWSLANTGYQGPALVLAKRYIESHMQEKTGAYTLAVIANFAADSTRESDREFTRRAMQALLDARSEQGDQVSWPAEETGVYSTGSSAAIETTGLATQALLKWGQASGAVRKALNFLTSTKQASGNWGTTQATIMALRAILLASESSASDVRGAVEVLLNGKPVKTLELTPGNNDLLHQFVFHNIDPHEASQVELRFTGSGGLAYQVVGRYFTPWEHTPAHEPLSISVNYDRTTLAQNDIATATATIRNNSEKTANMVMVDLGIPPGFELLSEDLQSFEEKSVNGQTGQLEKFSLTATQAILYFNALAPRQTVTVKFRLRAKYPIRAHTFASRVYEYYDPEISATAAPVSLDVR